MVTPDGEIVVVLDPGVPVSTVDVVLVVEVVSLVVGVTWPAVATGVVPLGWASAKAAGAERKSAIVAAETAAPPAHDRVVQLSDDSVPAPSLRIRSTCSRRSDHDSVGSSLSR